MSTRNIVFAAAVAVAVALAYALADPPSPVWWISPRHGQNRLEVEDDVDA